METIVLTLHIVTGVMLLTASVWGVLLLVRNSTALMRVTGEVVAFLLALVVLTGAILAIVSPLSMIGVLLHGVWYVLPTLLVGGLLWYRTRRESPTTMAYSYSVVSAVPLTLITLGL